jgi:hypothetical protein
MGNLGQKRTVRFWLSKTLYDLGKYWEKFQSLCESAMSGSLNTFGDCQAWLPRLFQNCEVSWADRSTVVDIRVIDAGIEDYPWRLEWIV